MRFRLAAAVAAIGLPMTAACTWAAEPKPEAFYVGLGIGQARQAARPPGDTNDLLLGWTVGYNFNNALAVEVYSQGYLFGSLRGWLGGLRGRAEQTDLADSHEGIAAVGAIALSDSWRLRGRAGVGRTRVAVYAAQSGDFIGNANRIDPTLGVGLVLDLSPRWTLSLDITRLMKTKVDTASLGWQFRF